MVKIHCEPIKKKSIYNRLKGMNNPLKIKQKKRIQCNRL